LQIKSLEENENFKQQYLTLKKQFATAKQAEKKSIIPWHIYFFIFVTIGISIICYLIIIPILFPLYLDGKIHITVQNIYWSLIPYLLVIFIPTMITLAAAVYLAIVHARSPSITFWQKLGVQVRALVWIDHVTVLSFVSCLGIFPVLHFCVYLRYWMTNTYNPLPYSYTLSAIPFFVYSLTNILIPVIIIISKGIRSQIPGENAYKAYLQVFSILFNVTAILETLLVTTKLDNVLNTYWVVLFTPIMTTPVSVTVLSYGFVFFARAVQIRYWQDYMHNITIGNAIMWAAIFLSIPAWVTWLLLLLRLDLFITVPFLNTFIPLYLLYATALVVFSFLVSVGAQRLNRCL
jgi:hypothetical protein